jgi:formylglycine-generating enzyme required for sulfatase activity
VDLYVTKTVFLRLTFLLAAMLPAALCSASDTLPQTYLNSIQMEFVRVPAGAFFMGAQGYEEGSSKEKPRHKVRITKPFYLGKYEVTQKQWLAVMGTEHPSNFSSPSRPVDEVSWNGVQAFLQKLNEIEKKGFYRLPTEAEWEYAARSGSDTSYCFGENSEENPLKHHAWYELNANKRSHPVGMLQPNAWGLYDMHGNVAEWVQDFYDKNYYAISPKEDPQGPETGRKRVVRGGSWIHQAYSCRSAFRGYFSADYTDSDFGFRVVKEIE